MGSLYVVATPIGNLEDITQRALRILDEVSLIAAEDTRTTGKLLDHHNISTLLTSFHEHNKEEKSRTLIEHMQQGDLALVSDAGTPGINDPGYTLVQAALEAGFPVIPIPGPSAPIAALSVSGLAADSFHYFGYMPRKSSSKKSLLQEVKRLPATLIFLETPHRLQDTLHHMKEILGHRKIALAREMTKIHEEILRGTLPEIAEHFETQEPRGEFTLVVEGATDENLKWSKEQLITELKLQKARGTKRPSRIAKDLAKISGWPRRTVYDLLNEIE